MSFYIKQQFISQNRSYENFTRTLKGIVIHSTSNIGATSLNHFNYWNNADRQSSVHYMIDWIGDEIYQFVPTNEVAWHIGNYTANREWLGVELCETNDSAQFDIVWKKAVWFIANICISNNWNIDDNVWSHNGMRSLYPGVDHTDPYAYLQKMGRSWKQLMDDINNEIARIKNNNSQSQPQQQTPNQTAQQTPKVEVPYTRPEESNTITHLKNVGYIETLPGRVIIHFNSSVYISLEENGIFAYSKEKYTQII